MCELKVAFEAIKIYQTQYTQVDKLWGYFSVVTLAMIGFVLSSDIPPKSFLEPMTIVAAYLVFCIGNHQALIAGQKQLEQFAIIAQACAGKAELEVSSINPIPHTQIKKFHLSVVIAVSIGVMIVAWF
ncbi:hypothetical protein Q4488_07180 [Amphritea sp. 1_MG-2023]|uniref:hypothetical protein n=1 Tax=Amphritea sp. 1_MG-2023 TaxID=3062670 RepID=UPI0026E26624|nr:hypothetical protein [Amphritea sp. 1_MG-2023]MDO6563169.1 hypothetical protein [Amphritea sp. 1_MG-2023]